MATHDTARIVLIAGATPGPEAAAHFGGDSAPTPSGLARAAGWAGRHPAARLTSCGPDAVARQTAAAFGLAPTIEPSLRPCDFGAWAGRSLEAVAAENPAAVGAWLRDPAFEPPGGESAARFIGRVGGWVEKCREGGGTTLAVVHPMTVRAVAAHILGDAAWFRLDVGFLSRGEFTHAGRFWRLHRLNAEL